MNNTKLIRLLAEGVMEWEIDERDGEWIKGDEHKAWFSEWNPLEDWNDCMMIVEKMVKDGYDFHAHWSPNNEQGLCQGMFEGLGHPLETKLYMHEEYETQDLKKAICKAAAKARGIEYE